MVYREYSYAALLVHLCCPSGARVLPLFWHYYSKVFTGGFVGKCGTIFSVYRLTS